MDIEHWLERCRGKMMVQMWMLNEEVVWLHFTSEEEVEEVLSIARD